MKVFLIYVRDEDFYRLLPPDLGEGRFEPDRVQVMAFPPLGIETLAPVYASTATRCGCSTPATRG